MPITKVNMRCSVETMTHSYHTHTLTHSDFSLSFSVAEIEPWLHRFRAEGTVDYSQLTFDPGQNELIVGAR